jgi:hypothetical protein
MTHFEIELRSWAMQPSPLPAPNPYEVIGCCNECFATLTANDQLSHKVAECPECNHPNNI